MGSGRVDLSSDQPETIRETIRETIVHISLKFQRSPFSNIFRSPGSGDNPVDEHLICVKCAHIKSQRTSLPKL